MKSQSSIESNQKDDDDNATKSLSSNQGFSEGSTVRVGDIDDDTVDDNDNTSDEEGDEKLQPIDTVPSSEDRKGKEG